MLSSLLTARIATSYVGLATDLIEPVPLRAEREFTDSVSEIQPLPACS